MIEVPDVVQNKARAAGAEDWLDRLPALVSSLETDWSIAVGRPCVHQLNALESDGGFKLVDPDGLLAEAEYDLGVLMRGDPVELLARDPLDRAFWLASRTGLEALATWEWGVVERMSSGLLSTQIGLQPLGNDSLRAAEFVAGMTIS